MFRLAARDHGLDRSAIHLETGIPKGTLKSWGCTTSDKVLFAVIPLTGLRQLVRVIPDELTSLLFSGTDKHVATDPGDEGDLDELAEAASELVGEHVRARSPSSPGGTNIVPIEREKIKEKGRAVCAKARAVAG